MTLGLGQRLMQALSHMSPAFLKQQIFMASKVVFIRKAYKNKEKMLNFPTPLNQSRFMNSLLCGDLNRYLNHEEKHQT